MLTRICRHRSWAELPHRLDRDTSGLLLVALDADMRRALMLELHDGWSRLALYPRSGHTILGDPLNGPSGHHPTGRQRLHASKLRFVHPFSGEPLLLQAPCPF